MENNPYPELSDAEIEELANDIYSDYLGHNQSDPAPPKLPVPVEEIAEQFL